MTTSAFVTPRLTLRPWSSSDLTAFHAVFGDPRVIYWGSFSRSLEESGKRLERAVAEQDLPRPGLGRYAVALRSTGAVIGNVNLRPANFAEGIELGYHFAHAAWGHGYATEAARATVDYGFDVVGLDRIIAAIEVNNARSLRVIAKLGFVQTYEADYAGAPHRMFERTRPPG